MTDLIKKYLGIGSSGLSRASAFFLFLFLLTACTGGDDDGRRLGEMIVGTWQCGWNEGDVVIEGDTEVQPESFHYDRFVFRNDGTYNGMVRKGTFYSTDKDGGVIFEGDYQCDNHNLRLEFVDEDGTKGKLLAQVVSFTDDTLVLKYVNEGFGVTVYITIRKLISQNL